MISVAVCCGVPVIVSTVVPSGGPLGGVIDWAISKIRMLIFEQRHEKTNYLHMRKQRCRSASQ